jgi:ATP-dependent Clp protease ATP-binding subunit ClpB
MKFDRFTVKSQEMIQQAHGLAGARGHQAIEPVHLIKAMLEEPEGIAVSILKRIGVPLQQIGHATDEALDRLVQVSGAGEIYISRDTKTVIDTAFAEAERMKDQYVSQEHILLALSDLKGPAGDLFRKNGVTRDLILGTQGDPRQSNHHGPQPRGQVPGPGEIRQGPDPAGPDRETGPGHRQG